MESPLVVLGGGPAGYAAAFRAADLGQSVTLIDMERTLGGVCLLRGCIPSKALLHVARAVDDARHLADWGVKIAQPEFDVAALRARKDKLIATLSGGLGQLAKKRNVKVVRARATFQNSQTLQLAPVGDAPLEDRELRFEHCLIATGSSPTQLPMAPNGGPRVMDSTGALDLPDVPESLLVVGGGYIGLELGTVYAALGSRVTVVEFTDGLLPGADRDLVRPLQTRLSKTFAAILLGTKVVDMADAGDAVDVTFEGNVEQKTQRFSRVLVSVGRRPNSGNLGLENTQVEIDEQGFIKIDAACKTADPRLLAVGDVAGQPMLAHKAAHQAKAAVETLLGISQGDHLPPVPAVVFTDPEIAWVGLTETAAKQEGLAVAAAQFPWMASGRAQSVGRTEGLTKWIIDPATDRLLGCGIVGPGAGDLISEASLAITLGATVRDVAQTIHPHPTLSETLGVAAEVFLGTATDIHRPKRTGR